MALTTFEAPTPTAMRRCMGRLIAGVCVVTADDAESGSCGMTISSMTSISLDPAILLVSLTHGSRTTDTVDKAGRFAVSILSARQEAIARRFATRGGARFEGLDCDTGDNGLPLIKDAGADRM
ncbi:flavin reductase family protein [Rhodococcus sp. JVH1]|uniref:flavin reductase family protein n=1 Tax=Rhodococcus sp. JVH1 TaxID=745408 RepID=UPI000271F357|nr:flavin reductase family protein [Rhodococcus sp. JVH1]EJJ01742.1 flavin reductase like domain protein [Rhodococcus sp. JVH1]